jgi:transposase
MNGYSEDLRRKIVSAVEGAMSKSQAARTFGVSLSSVKRYVGKADREESLAPKKSPGSPAKLDEKAGRLLAADLEERPFATLQERRDYVEAITGLSVSRSTVCRAIARIGSTRKKQPCWKSSSERHVTATSGLSTSPPGRGALPPKESGSSTPRPGSPAACACKQ